MRRGASAIHQNHFPIDRTHRPRTGPHRRASLSASCGGSIAQLLRRHSTPHPAHNRLCRAESPCSARSRATFASAACSHVAPPSTCARKCSAKTSRASTPAARWLIFRTRLAVGRVGLAATSCHAGSRARPSRSARRPGAARGSRSPSPDFTRCTSSTSGLTRWTTLASNSVSQKSLPKF